MVILEGETLILDRSQDGDDVLPLLHTGKGGRTEWYVDLGVAQQDVLHFLVDAEVLDEDIPARYIAAGGQQAEVTLHVEELISGPEEGDVCRLRGVGPAPAVFLADAPRKV